MNTRFLYALRLCVRTALFTLALFASASVLKAQTLSMSQINMYVWANLYGVTPAQYNSSAWLAEDSDGDGISNGAEMAAGTDPFSAGSTIQITSMTVNGGNLSVTFPTLTAKQYILESNTNLANTSGWTQVSGTSPVSGSNAPATITAAYAANTFYRVLVQDVSTTNDGMSDWAALKLGLNPSNSQSNGTTNAFGQYLTDNVFASNQITAQNVVTISTPDPTGTEPTAGVTATDTGEFTITRGGMSAMLGALTVSVTIGGNAVSGTDYTPLSTTVTFPAGVTAENIVVTPLSNANLQSPASVTMTIAPGSGYTVGSPSVAGVTLYPQGLNTGTGLTGNYYNYSSSTYSAPQNFFGTPVVANKLDGGVSAAEPTGGIGFIIATASAVQSGGAVTTVNITNGGYGYSSGATFTFSGGGGSGAAATPVITNGAITGATITSGGSGYTSNPSVTVSPPSNGFLWATKNANGIYGPAGGGTTSTSISQTNYSIKWTGQVQPLYTEPLTFEVDARDGVVLTVGGQTVISDWRDPGQVNTTSNPQIGVRTGTFNAVAGVRYDIELDYYTLNGGLSSVTNNTAPQVALWWYSYDQPRELIPAANLYPSNTGSTAAPPTITSAINAVGYVNQPFTFNVTTSSNLSSTTISVLTGSLPAGLSFAQTTVNGIPVGQISGTPTLAGNFPLTMQASNPAGTSTSVLNLQIIDSGVLSQGIGLTNQVWTGLTYTNTPAGAAVSNIPTSTTPNITNTLTSLEDTTTTYGNDYGQQITGYIVVNQTGNYYFWLAANDAAQLWISTSAEPGADVLRASITGGTGTASNPNWTSTTVAYPGLPGSQSGWIALTAGQKYYLKVLHQGNSGAANFLAVAYYLDSTGNSGFTPSGLANVVPGYMLYPYYSLPVAFASTSVNSGTLYYTQLAPENGAVTNGSGLATLLLNSAATQATLNYNYDGLTTPLTQHHLHADAYTDGNGVQHTPSEIVFDLDTATPTGPNQYVWNITPVGDFTNAADLVTMLQQGKCYLNLHTVNYPNGEIRGNFTLAKGAQTFVPPAAQTFTPPVTPTTADASRFLSQATFGPSPSDLTYVTTNNAGSGYGTYPGTSNGFRSWLEYQLSLTPSLHSPLVSVQASDGTTEYETMSINAWWQRSVTAPDQLRQRVAFALSEIMVISMVGSLNEQADQLSGYYDTLLKHAFDGADTGTSFLNLLTAVTLHPAMGQYLNMQGNQKGNLATGVHANENYAREIHQLFTIGLNRLWPDGSLVLDSHFNLIPTYNQTFIQNVTPVFTGWSYGQTVAANGRLPTGFTGLNVTPTGNYACPMTLTSSYHDLGQKQVLDNVWLPAASVTVQSNTNTDPAYPANQSNWPYYNTNLDGTTTAIYNLYDEYGLKDLNMALNSIFNHQNLAPFLCRQLIQRLVTSNPSPGYVYRVSQAFNGLGDVDGVVTNYRGDMKETIRAILMDYEARSDNMLASTNTTFGKQREPLLRATAPARYFSPTPSAAATYQQPSTIGTDGTAHPGRIEIDLTGVPFPYLTTSDQLNLSFATVNSGHLLTGSYNGYNFPVKYVSTASPEKLEVEAFGEPNGTYNQSGTTITVSLSGHGLTAGGQIYLVFAPGTGGTPAAGLYTVLSTGLTTSVFEVTAGSSATITGSADVILNSISSSGVSPNSVYTTVNTPIAHGLVAGNTVNISGSGTVLGGGTNFTVLASPAPTATSFAIATPGGLALEGISGLIVYPLIAPDINRNGTMTMYSSNWQISYTDVNTADLMQTPLRSATVFNFFYPGYMFPGSQSVTLNGSTPTITNTIIGTLATNGITSPEFQLSSGANTMALTNFIENGLYNGTTGNYTTGLCSFRGGNDNIVMDMSGLMAYFTAQGGLSSSSNAGVTAVITKLNNELAGGNISSGTQGYISAYVNTTNFPTSSSTQVRDAVRAIVYLILVSPEFAIQK